MTNNLRTKSVDDLIETAIDGVRTREAIDVIDELARRAKDGERARRYAADLELMLAERQSPIPAGALYGIGPSGYRVLWEFGRNDLGVRVMVDTRSSGKTREVFAAILSMTPYAYNASLLPYSQQRKPITAMVEVEVGTSEAARRAEEVGTFARLIGEHMAHILTYDGEDIRGLGPIPQPAEAP